MVDIGKSINASLLPTTVYVILGIVVELLEKIPFLIGAVLGCLLIVPKIIIGPLILAWAGYKAVKEKGSDLVGAALAGAFSGATGLTIVAIAAFIMQILGIIPAAIAAGAPETAGEGMMTFTSGIFGGVVGVFAIGFYLVTGILLGAIMGAIGGIIAGQKSTAKPAVSEKIVQVKQAETKPKSKK
ncbi:MAG: hypothetical protein AABX38_04505 [Candidatus Micrarchaeota archaeon]